MKRILAGFLIGIAVIGITGAAVGTVFRSMTVVADANIGSITCAVATGNGELCVENDIESNGNLDIAGTATITGAGTFTAGFTSPVVGTSLMRIRFCGNGPDGATTTYISPVAEGQIATNFEYGSAGCDGEDSTTEATADEVFHIGYALKPVAMSCVALCTGATAANDVVVFQLKDDTVAVTGLTCSTSALGGDATPAQCSVRTSSPATIAAGSAIDVSIVMTNDDCNDAGDDFECNLFVTF